MDGHKEMTVVNFKRRTKCSKCGWSVIAYNMNQHKAKYHPKPAHLLEPKTNMTKRDPKARTWAQKSLEKILKCSYCGQHGSETRGPDGLRWALDHVLPIKLGGKDIMDNFVKSCQSCNSRKGAKSIAPPGSTITASGKKCEDTENWYNIPPHRRMKEHWEGVYIK